MKTNKKLGAGKKSCKTNHKNKLTKAGKKIVTKKIVTSKKPAKKITKATVISKPAKNVVENVVKTNSQYDTVLNHLVKHGSINTMEAIKSYNVLRLGAVIFNLRQGGMEIKIGRA